MPETWYSPWVPQVWKEGGLSHAELKAVCNTAKEALLSNVRSACARDLKWFHVADECSGHVAIVGGGPSVKDKIDEIKWRESVGQQIWVLNNAAKALGSIEIDAQVLLDARPENIEFITWAKEYLVASQCAPIVLDLLTHRDVTLWHVNTPGIADILKDEKDRLAYLVGGGTTVGMNAIALAFLRGYRQIHLYGFDSCYHNGEHHAYKQPLNDQEPRNEVLYRNKTYVCAPWMVGQAQEFMQQIPNYVADGCVITVHGTGLIQDIARDMVDVQTPTQLRAAEILNRVGPGTRGAEVGVFAADLSRELLRADPRLNLVLVDSWEGDGKSYQGGSGDWHAALTQDAQDEFFAKTQQRISFANGRALIIKKRSSDAAADIPDASLDFVFIDADHSYAGCKADIESWSGKIKRGGWLCGHDYENPDFDQFGVTQAVNEFVAQHALKLEIGNHLCWFVKL